jgi:Rrf2 family transcriptional regulator, cysteine metabolism repressor
MKISAKIDYACRALLELALHWPNSTPMQVGAIAKRQKIPMNFLVHILITLKEAGYVESLRGKSGGYVLIKAPQEIKLGDVIKNFGGLGLSDGTGRKKNAHILDSVWQEVDNAVVQTINNITLEALCNRERNRGNTIMYDI